MEEKYRWYRTEIPNTLDDAGLSPSAYRLYGHIKRVAGDNGLCRDTSRQMADKCKMSLGMVSIAKKELLDAGLINVAGRAAHGLDIIEVTNIWPQNYEKYSQRSQYERCDEETDTEQAESSDQTMNAESSSVHNMNTEIASVHNMNVFNAQRSQYEHNKKEQTTNNKTLTFTDVKVDEPPKRKTKAAAPKKTKDPPEVLERRRVLKAAWLETSKAKNFSNQQVNAGIKQLERAGCLPDELIACYVWMAAEPFWFEKTIYPQSIFKKIDEHRRSLERKTNTNGAQRNGKHFPTYQPAAFDEDLANEINGFK